MELPAVKYSGRLTKQKQIRFAGLNHNLGAGEGELFDMTNMTGDYYPLLASRAPRYLYKRLTNPGGIFSWKKLCWVEDGQFYYDGQVKGAVLPGLKTFSAMGANIMIMPDKCFYNVETDTFGSMEVTWTGESLTFCDGVLFEEEAKANCIQAEGVSWEDYFRVGDAIFISGCTKVAANNKSDIVRAIDGDKLYFYEYAFTLEEEAAYQESGVLSISRTVPDMTYLCENNNRIWGCSDSTIYCCKQDDIFNWNIFDGLDSDAWAITPTAPGKFTGCFAYGSYPIMFKEDHIYKVYGSLPSSFSPIGSATLGLAEGSAGSLAVAGETLFYLGVNGIMAYTGGVPQSVSEAFGLQRFKNAVGGSDGLKYYVSMQDSTGAWGLYVFDTRKGTWHKEDETHVTHFAKADGNLYFLNEAGEIWVISSGEDLPEEAERETEVAWMAEFADFTGEDPNKKSAGKIQLRLELEENATAQVWLQFDSDGKWIQAGDKLGTGVKRSYYLPIVPRRCDHYRLRITGTGVCRIYSISREVSPGSELKSKYGRN